MKLKMNKLTAFGGWLVMTQSYSDLTFPALAWLDCSEGQVARWLGCSEGQVAEIHRQPVSFCHRWLLRPEPTSAGFQASGLRSLSSSVSQSLQPGRPSPMQYYIYTTEQKVLCPSSPQFLIVAPFRITECITWSESLRRFSSPLFSSI